MADGARAQDPDPASPAEQPERTARDLTANVPDERMYTWESQAAQYPSTGEPGITYLRGELTDESFVDCLLFRDESGELVGILNHYQSDIPPYERAGDENIWVHPARQRQGIGTALILEARFRWAPNPNPGDPKVTEAGVQFLRRLEEKYAGSEYDPRTGWEAWRERRAEDLEDPSQDWRALGWEGWHERQAREGGVPEISEPPGGSPDT